MNKNTFNEIIKLSAYSEKSTDYHALLERALKKYPYASILHITAARMNGSASEDSSEEILEAALNRVSDPRLIFEPKRSFSDRNPDSPEVLASHLPEVDVSSISVSDSLDRTEKENNEENKTPIEKNGEPVTEQVREEDPPRKGTDDPTEDAVVSEKVLADAEMPDERDTSEANKEESVENKGTGDILVRNMEGVGTETDTVTFKGDASDLPFSLPVYAFGQMSEANISDEKAEEFLDVVRGAVSDFREYEKNCFKKVLKEIKYSSERAEKKKNEELKQLKKLRKKKIEQNRAIIADMLAKMVSEVDRFTREDSKKLLSALLENYAEQGRKEKKSKRRKENGVQILKAIPENNKHAKKTLSPPQKVLKPIRVSREPAVDTEIRPDLSLKSVKINEELISENLAKILAKQGKKGQAVEMYKRLGLKYPEKKAYFADIVKQLEG